MGQVIKISSLPLLLPVSDSFSPLRLNVGFITHQTIGYSRSFDFNIPNLHIPPDLNLRNLVGNSLITRTPQGLLVQTKLQASVLAECARCLIVFEQPLSIDFSELYAFNQKSVTESGLILPENGYINLGPLVREYMFLEVPINPLCRSDCKGLCLECGANLNEGACGHVPPTGDSRFDILKALL
jgi:uncharacterized protein